MHIPHAFCTSRPSHSLLSHPVSLSEQYELSVFSMGNFLLVFVTQLTSTTSLGLCCRRGWQYFVFEIWGLLGYYAVSCGVYRRFGTTYKSHLQGSFTMGPISCPETSVNNYHTTPCNIPEQRRSHQHNGGSLRSRHYFILNERSEVVTAVLMNITLLFNLTPCTFVNMRVIQKVRAICELSEFHQRQQPTDCSRL
jgi:hypothetical protein